MSLSEMSLFFRQFVKVAIAGVILLIIGWFTWSWVSDYIRRTFVAPPPPPNFALGYNIPSLKIPLEKTNLDGVKVQLDTINGQLPPMPESMPIYQVPLPTASLLSLDRAVSIAKSLGFNSTPNAVEETEYQWTDSETGRNLNLKTTDFNFHLVQDNPFPKKLVNFSEKTAISDVRNFLSSRQLLHPELDEATPTAKFVSITENGIQESKADVANGVLVDMVLKDLDGKYPLLNLNPKQALVRAVVTYQKPAENQRETRNIAELKYTFWKIDPKVTTSGTYPIKSIVTVWNDFKTGKSLVSLDNKPYDTIKIKEIKLGYLLTESYQQYIQPIYIFKGKTFNKNASGEDFMSYLPAIASVTPLKK